MEFSKNLLSHTHSNKNYSNRITIQGIETKWLYSDRDCVTGYGQSEAKKSWMEEDYKKNTEVKQIWKKTCWNMQK